MNRLKTGITALFIGFTMAVSAQDAKLLDKIPEKKEDYKASEPKVIATVNWIENTPLDEKEEMHKLQYGLLIGWISGSPSVTLTLHGYIMDYMKKNDEMLIFFMGGWTRYVLENDYSDDLVQCNLAGIRSMIKMYKTGKLKKDKKMQQLVDMDAEGKLEAWVKEQIGA